jgi:tRNA(His) 5'-end guanylyltransferase
MRDTLGDRVKKYENVSNGNLTPRSPAFIRVDGKAFHTFTKGCDKPFDHRVIGSMLYATEQTADQMQGFKLAYTQSDEATFMITDTDTLETQGWFSYEINKLVSITASMFTYYFNREWDRHGVSGHRKEAFFDARAFTVPIDDAPNIFIWRQRDWERNSIQMIARSLFSHKELEGKKINELISMIEEQTGREIEAGYSPMELYGSFTNRDSTWHQKEDYGSLTRRLA